MRASNIESQDLGKIINKRKLRPKVKFMDRYKGSSDPSY